MNSAQRYLLCYDIADPDRLAVVGRYMARRAVRVQYSVFWLRTTPAGLAALLADLAVLIHPAQDDVRCYPLAARALWQTLGAPLLGEAGTLVGDVPGAPGGGPRTAQRESAVMRARRRRGPTATNGARRTLGGRIAPVPRGWGA